MTTEQVIERAEREGVTADQIAAVVERWLDANVYRLANGYPPIDLEDVMPRYLPVQPTPTLRDLAAKYGAVACDGPTTNQDGRVVRS